MRLILLHSPLLGSASWRLVADEALRRGQPAETPAWPRFSTVQTSYYAALTDSLAATIDSRGAGEPAVLAAHSGAGALLPALIARLRTPVAGVIFIDAILPHPGQSWFDTAPADLRAHLRAGAQDGQLPAWDAWWPPGALARLVPDEAIRQALIAGLEPLPVDYFEEAAPQAQLTVPGAYLQLSGAYDEEARLAGRNGWPVVRLPMHHLAMLTHPQAVAGALESLAGKLAERQP